MQNHDPNKNKVRRRAKSKADFIRRIGIGPDLARFLTDFTERPEILFSLPLDRYREIEYQMDAILSSFEKR
jgi:fructose 1,6-bisphosphatase